VGGDIIENKKTYLYLKALQYAEEGQRDKLAYLFTTQPEDSAEKIEDVKYIFRTTGADEATKTAIADYTQKAFDTLEKMDISTDKKEILRAFGENLMQRKV
jgi:geranylgeranyl diphosphate synthase type II